MRAAYSAGFKKKMIEKMMSPGGPSVAELSEKAGVHQTTLSRWLREGTTVPAVSKRKTKRRGRAEPPRQAAPRRPQDWSPEDKLQALRDSEGLEDAELGAYLRRVGLHDDDLAQWREQAQQAALAALGGRKQRSADSKRIRNLQREVQRKDRALAEAAALLVLAKKARALWADEDDDTTGSNDE